MSEPSEAAKRAAEAIFFYNVKSEVAIQSAIDSATSPLRDRIAVLEGALRAVEALINESRGVAGLHLNGDEAPWAELRTGGRFEDWLLAFDKALEAK